MLASTALIFLILASALTLGISVKRIPEGQVYTLHRAGRAAPRMLKPGMHWVWPLIEHVTHRISLVGRTLDLDSSGDHATHLTGTIYWQVLEPERADAVIERAENMIREQAHSALPRLCALDDEVIRNQTLKQELNAALTQHGIFVARARTRLS